jgi:sucrose phosphorylase
MRPTEGLLDDEQRSKLFERLERNGAYFSYKTNTDGTKSVYEVNSSLYNALEKTDLDQKGKFKIERWDLMNI